MKSIWMIVLMRPTAVWAETAEKAAQNLTTGSLLQTFLGLIFVLLLIGIMAWLLKRSQQLNHTGQGQFRVLSAVALGPKEKAVLLQLGEQQLLLGVTQQQVNLLHQLSEPLHIGENRSVSPAFANKLKQMLKSQSAS